jgi:hypothetical protein
MTGRTKRAGLLLPSFVVVACGGSAISGNEQRPPEPQAMGGNVSSGGYGGAYIATNPPPLNAGGFINPSAPPQCPSSVPRDGTSCESGSPGGTYTCNYAAGSCEVTATCETAALNWSVSGCSIGTGGSGGVAGGGVAGGGVAGGGGRFGSYNPPLPPCPSEAPLVGESCPSFPYSGWSCSYAVSTCTARVLFTCYGQWRAEPCSDVPAQAGAAGFGTVDEAGATAAGGEGGSN